MKKSILFLAIVLSFIAFNVPPSNAQAPKIVTSPSSVTLSAAQSANVNVTLSEPIITMETEGVVTLPITTGSGLIFVSPTSLEWTAAQWAQTRMLTITNVSLGDNVDDIISEVSGVVESNSEYYDGYEISIEVVLTGTGETDHPSEVTVGFGESGNTTQSNVAAGSKVTVNGSGFLPNSQVGLEMRSNPVSLGSFGIGGSGSFTHTFTIPSNTEPGAHQLIFSGTDSNGDPVTKVLDVQVSALANTGISSRYLAVFSTIILMVGVGLTLVSKKINTRYNNDHVEYDVYTSIRQNVIPKIFG